MLYVTLHANCLQPFACPRTSSMYLLRTYRPKKTYILTDTKKRHILCVFDSRLYLSLNHLIGES